MEELLSGEVARRLGVHPITITRWIAQGKLKFRVNQHGWRMFQAGEVDRLAKERRLKRASRGLPKAGEL